jgi:phosphatidate cytidylyltransferase
MHHMVVNLIAISLSSMGAVEFAAMLTKKDFALKPRTACILGALAPLGQTLSVSFGFPDNAAIGFIITGAAFALIAETFRSKDHFAGTVNRTAAAFSALIYPGLFMGFVVRMTGLHYAKVVILIFIFTVISSDSVAWLFGMLLGKTNKGIVAASPNKSAAGFFGAFLGPVLICIAGGEVWRIAFTPRLPSGAPPLVLEILLGLITGLAAILGDLGESALKRSSKIKDSGVIVPGRGGILDSIDSISLAAPVFYFCYFLLFKT